MIDYSLERVQALWKLMNLDHWSEDLLNKTLFPEVHEILTPKERNVLGLLISNTPQKKILELQGICLKTLKNIKWNLKYVLKNGARTESDLENRIKRMVYREGGKQ